jgi:hypothetical protein
LKNYRDFLKFLKQKANQESDLHKGDDGLRPIEHLTPEEKFIYKSAKRDLKKCKSYRDLAVLEKTLDVLLERAMSRIIKHLEKTN